MNLILYEKIKRKEYILPERRGERIPDKKYLWFSLDKVERTDWKEKTVYNITKNLPPKGILIR